MNQTDACPICGKTTSAGAVMTEHHIIWRSRGGTDGPTIRVCSECHAHLNAEKTGGTAWDVDVYSEQKLVVVERGSGALVMEREYPPEDWDEGVFVAQLTEAPDVILDMSRHFVYLSHDGIVSVAEALQDIMQSSWVARARLAEIAMQRIPYGHRMEVLDDLARQIDVSSSQLRKEVRALDIGTAAGLDLQSLANWTPDVLVEAGKSTDPTRALTEVLTPERGSVAKARRNLAEAGLAAPPPEKCVCVCAQCGAEVWHNKPKD